MRRFLANLWEIKEALPGVSGVEGIGQQVFVVFRPDESETGESERRTRETCDLDTFFFFKTYSCY